MDMGKFVLLDKVKLEQFLPALFEILYSNMRFIAPTGNSYHEDFTTWRSYIVPDMQKDQRQIVLIYVDDKLAGFFRYDIKGNHDSLMMEEIQITKEFQGTGLFSQLYQWLVQQLPKDILYTEAYAHKNNEKSQAILEYLGLARMGENKNGISFYYKGRYSDLLRKYT